MMLRLFSSISGKSSKKPPEESDETVEQLTDKCTVENLQIIEPQSDKSTKESAPKSIKRKLDHSKKVMKFLRPSPNFFVALQVNDVGIHQKVKKLQEKLISKNPKLFPALINIPTLHITLAVTHLANENDINVVKDKMDAWAQKNIQKYFSEPCILSFNGVKTFRNVVAYVDIEQNEEYKKILELSKNINKLLSSAGYMTDKKNFHPHLTVLKLSKDLQLQKSQKSFKDDFEALKQCKDHFGKQKLTYIQLLSMNEPKDKFGYYKCYYQIKISDPEVNMDHSDCCTPIPKPERI